MSSGELKGCTNACKVHCPGPEQTTIEAWPSGAHEGYCNAARYSATGQPLGCRGGYVRFHIGGFLMTLCDSHMEELQEKHRRSRREK